MRHRQRTPSPGALSTTSSGRMQGRGHSRPHTTVAKSRAEVSQAEVPPPAGLNPLWSPARRSADKLRQPAPCVKHARFDRSLRNLKNRGRLRNGLVVVVDQVDDFGVLGRQAGQATPQDFTQVLVLQNELRIV